MENRLTVEARSKSPLCDRSVIEFQLVEDNQVRFTGALIVWEGHGRYETSLDQVPMPQEREFKVRLRPIHTLDLLAKVEEDASLEIISDLLKEPDPPIRRGCVELLAAIGKKKVKENLRRSLDDPDSGVRRLVREALH